MDAHQVDANLSHQSESPHPLYFQRSLRLALGTVQFGLDYGVANQGGRVSLEEAGLILGKAAVLGIDTLDTAVAYGESESTLGRIGAKNWRIVTKLPGLPDGCPDIERWVLAEAEASLKRLGVGHVHAMLLHRPGQLLDAGGDRLLKALERLKQEGYVSKIGASIYTPNELGPLFENMQLDLVQAPLNILDRRLVESGWARRLNSLGVELHVRSAFLQGLLLMDADARPSFFSRWQSVWIEWERWLAENRLTPLQACLRYALSVEEVDRVVVGVDNQDQLQQIVIACAGGLPSLPAWPAVVDTDLLNPACWNSK